jgi:hypothetical protein
MSIRLGLKINGEMQSQGVTILITEERQIQTITCSSSSKSYDSPLDQLYRLGLEKDELIGVELIGSLDDDGYLRGTV